MKCRGTFTLEWNMSDFYKYATPLAPKIELKKALYMEMLCCVRGVIDGFSVPPNGWKYECMYHLFKKGLIGQTALCIEEYGDFKLLKN